MCFWSRVLVLIAIVKLVVAFQCDSRNGEKLQVHLVPHSHDDVGWQKTIDQYYYGANRTIQGGAVQYILDTSVEALLVNKNRTFIYVEMAFFRCWWRQQNASIQEEVKKLVAEKRLEFINGGWCMNDEATTHYNGIIDQMTYGLEFIRETFGDDARPTIAWQIDPFGHSAEQASLFSLMSFDGLFFGRLDFADKTKRMKEKRMELIWRGSRNYGAKSDIFTGVLYNGYDPPKEFCYDDFCSDPPIQDDPDSDPNVKERVDAFVEAVCEQADSYQTSNVMLTMGSDFQYENAHRWYKNLDKLIKYVNEDGRVHAFYSTPSRYLDVVHQSNISLEVKTDDFFPYSHCAHCYWTGYFTSRPTLKGYTRNSNNLLQACNQLEVLSGVKMKHPSSDRLRAAVAVMQHHDAVTGTEKQHVADDYAKRLSIGRTECQSRMSQVIAAKYSSANNATASSAKSSDKPDFKFCEYLNISVCPETEDAQSIAVNIYNPLAHPVSTPVWIPLNFDSVSVSSSDGNAVSAQLLPVSKETIHLRRHHKGYAAYQLVFMATLPALGFNTYFVNRLGSSSSSGGNSGAATLTNVSKLESGNDFIENDLLKLEFSAETGRLISMISKKDQVSVSLDQQFFWYEGSIGDMDSIQTSGAYIFRPNKQKPDHVCEDNKAKATVIKGSVVQEVRQTFGGYVSQVIRLYRNADYAEFEHTVGPIPITDAVGKEIITRFDSNIESNDTFFTDANGREMKERRINHRDTWKMNITEPVAGNYYPINSRIYIKDDKTQLTVMSDRSQGGSSLSSGQLEVMVHRRLLRDDFLGVGESLLEPGEGNGIVTRGAHRVFLTTPEKAASYHRKQAQMMMLAPIISFAKNELSVDKWKEKFATNYSALAHPLPENVHLLTLQQMNNGQVLLRLEHFFEGGEDAELSKPATVELKGLFKEFKITAAEEVNLSANQKIVDKKMLQWRLNKNSSKRSLIEQRWSRSKWQKHKQGRTLKRRDASKSAAQRSLDDALNVQLQPMEIRSFLLDVQFGNA